MNTFADEEDQRAALCRQEIDLHLSALPCTAPESPAQSKPRLNYKAAGGQVIGLLGAKGGSGTSSLALNLAACLTGGPAALIDAHLLKPQLATMLQRQPEYSLFEVIDRSPNIDLHLLEACAEKIGNHCLLLAAPADFKAALARNLGQLAEALSVMKTLLPNWVIDLPEHLDMGLVQLLDQLDKILLVFEPTLLAVSAAARQLKLLLELEYDSGKVILVANRCNKRTRQVEKDLKHCFAGYTIATIPNDFDLLQSCLLAGETAISLKPASAYCKAVNKLAHTIEHNTPARK